MPSDDNAKRAVRTVAIGAFALEAPAVGKAGFQSMEIDEMTVRRRRVGEIVREGDQTA